MTEALQQRCALFIQSRAALKAAFSLDSTYIHLLCATLCAFEGVLPDITLMKDMKRLLKEETTAFSGFRGISRLVTITKLSLSSSPEQQLNNILSVYGYLKEMFHGSEYLAAAATAIAELADSSDYAQIAQRTRIIYDRMKNAHPFLTSGEDSAFAALLAMSGLDDMRIEQDMAQCYAILKPHFFVGNAVQALSGVLALSESNAEEKCQAVLTLFGAMKERGFTYGTNYELPTLGALVLSEADIGALTQEIIDIDEFLKTQKGFGAFSVGARQRLMYAGILKMGDYIPGNKTIMTAAQSGVISMIVAQEAAICAATAAACAAAASSASS